jgi:hypothetical protein
MRYMYTTEPTEDCHQFDGVWGKPVHTSEQKKLLKLGWRFDPNGLRNERQEAKQEGQRQEESVDTEEDVLEEARQLYEEQFGKRPHHKMKAETIIQKVQEAND